MAMIVLLLTCILLLSTTAVSQIFNLTIDATTCIAPGDYTTVYDAIAADETACMNIAGNNVEAQQGCGCASFVKQINNFASACWNRIYGCEYQGLVVNYLELCQIATLPVPYWPAPENAPGSCSCNAGLVYETYLAAEARGLRCLKNATSMEINNLEYSSQMDIACGCCAIGVTISGMYDICPNTDPKLIGLNKILDATAATIPWSSCGPSLQEFDCVNELGYEAPLSTGTVYNPTDLPASGTQTLSDIAGEVTSPASGAVFTYSAVGSEWTVSALSINNQAAMTTENSAAGTNSASQGGSGSTATGGNTATGTSATGKSGGSETQQAKSGADKLEMSLRSLFGAIVLCGAVLAL